MSLSKVVYPIIMLDCSGSTSRDIDISKYYKDVDNLLKYQINIAQRILRKFEYVYVIMWNYTGFALSPIPIRVSELAKICCESLGGTLLSKGFDAIPDEWINKTENNKLFIFTDGEIEDGENVAIPLKKLIDLKFTIQIITVEPNDINYMKTKADAGHVLFQIIKTNGLTKHVRRFSSYNEHHVIEPYICFDNPEEIKGFTLFKEVKYDIAEQKDELIDTVEDAIKNCETKDELIKIAHDISITVHHIIKDKPINEQLAIINEFADLFAESPVEPTLFTSINKLLLTEAENVSTGNASTFYDFKDALIPFFSNQ